MTIQEQADMIIAYLQENGLNHDQMLAVCALARKKLEAIKAEEQLNKPNKQIKIFEEP
ncbi:hypothetical protein [Sphingobacterium hotanense]|uniref:Uncharacterized protein n=1 Tax=Sphingobacterium hotanense TaxID=649196 RepID=A0ABT7NME9_9SPHI|nr:hypothetical protein [Sphingobacterium hotanense]MDM1048404.1 hypothetical protein [Sphingobacterium hotanense]